MAQPAATVSTPIDDQAKRLADFFNGEVVQLDGPLPELEAESAA
jgi:DNA polymerase-3 subunit gamma/tau